MKHAFCVPGRLSLWPYCSAHSCWMQLLMKRVIKWVNLNGFWQFKKENLSFNEIYLMQETVFNLIVFTHSYSFSNCVNLLLDHPVFIEHILPIFTDTSSFWQVLFLYKVCSCCTAYKLSVRQNSDLSLAISVSLVLTKLILSFK